MANNDDENYNTILGGAPIWSPSSGSGAVSWSGTGTHTQDTIDADIPVYDQEVYVDDLTADERKLALAKAQNGVTSLADFVDITKFIENPLNVFDSYTYNLEWFVVDREANRKFQLEESFIIKDIVENNWPGPNDNKVIIAKTGVTTEFNITDLTIDSGSFGNSNYSKIAGVADKVSFTVTQVGESSLAENLQNAVTLCGFYTIKDAIFYIKINFVGHKDGKVEKINQTKVIPFTITHYDELSTSTDSRGTTTVIDGQVPVDAVVMDIDVSQNDYGFDFKVGSTLKESLDAFFEELNKSVLENRKTLEPHLKHSYSYTFSKQFKDVGFPSGSMTGVSWDQIKNFRKKGKNNAEVVGQVLPNNLIYGVIEEICLVSDEVRKELKRESHTTNKVLKITPNLAIKEGGYNPVSGKNTYDVGFFIDYEEKIIDQNMLNQQAKVLSHREIIQNLFDSLHINKKYDYLFTGNNDQILDFNITLDAELTKTYSTPEDFWAYEHFIKEGTEGIYISDAHQEIIDKNKAEAKKLKDIDIRKQKAAKDAATMLTNQEDTYKSRIMNAHFKKYGVMQRMGHSVNGNWIAGNMMPPSEMEDIFAGKSLIDLTTQYANEEFMKELGWDGDNSARMNFLTLEKARLQKNANESNAEFVAAELLAQESYMDAVTNTISSNINKSYEGIKSAFKNIKTVNRNSKNMILLEELDNDFISKMSNEDYKIILKAQASNPITYQRMIKKMGDENRSYTLKPADDIDLDIVKAKYYESKVLKQSMINAQITIKGDPYWLEGYMPAGEKTLKKTFGNGGGDRLGLNIQTTKNGYNGMILISGVSDGVDLHDNVLKRNLITSLYTVHTCTSSFSNGIFTQSLTMVKNTQAEHFTSDAGVISAGQLTELTDKNTDKQEVDKTVTTVKWKTDAQMNLEMGFNADGTNPNYHGSLAEQHGKGLIYKGRVLTPEEVMMMKAMEPYENRTGPGQKVISTIVDNHLTKNTAQYVDKQIVTTEQTITAQNDMVITPMPDGNAAIRNVLANQTLKQLEDLRNICKVEQKRGQIPFVACDTINNINGEMLETFGLTEEDKGKASTITAMNTQINSWITNDGITFNDEEIAVYQIAAGGQLDIIGHDKDVVEKLVRKATLERTPEIIIEEQANGTASADVSSVTSGAIVDNKILNDELPLVTESVDSSLVNVDLEQTYEEIVASGEDVTKKLMLLSVDLNEQAKQQYFEDKKNEQILKESEPVKVFNPKTRRLEIKGVNNNILTDGELFDVSVLSDGINNIVEKTVLTSDNIHREITWKENAVEIIEKEIIDEDLVISDEEKTAMKFSAATSINKSVALDALSDADYERISRYEIAINKITEDAQSGHRGDLTKAVNIGKIQGELVTSSLKQDVIINKTYYFDPGQRVVDAISLEELELDAAIKVLSLPAETMTEVATVVTGSDTEYVPIMNPVEQIDVEKQPVVVKTQGLPLNTYDIILPGSLKEKLAEVGGSINSQYLGQYHEALKIYKLITSYDYGDLTTVTDDYGVDIEVKDFNNVGPITYTDATGTTQTISDPSAFFGIYTTTYDDMNPAYARDYDVLKTKISDLFPNVESGQKSQLINGKLPRGKDGMLMITISGDKFYVNPNP